MRSGAGWRVPSVLHQANADALAGRDGCSGQRESECAEGCRWPDDRGRGHNAVQLLSLRFSVCSRIDAMTRGAMAELGMEESRTVSWQRSDPRTRLSGRVGGK
jgi:hypothetical protein